MRLGGYESVSGSAMNLNRVPYFLGVIITALFVGCTPNRGSFSLINKAGEPITYASVTICGQKIELTDLLPNEIASGAYEVTSDSHYSIAVQFQSGKALQQEIGYVTNGMDFHHEITITNSTILIAEHYPK